MEKTKKRIWFCLFFIVLTAVVVGILYYYGQLNEQSAVNQRTLISGLGMGQKQVCR